MVQSLVFQWHRTVDVRTRSVFISVIGVVVIVGAAVGLVFVQEYWLGAAFLVLSLASFPAFVTPSPRVEPREGGVAVLPKARFVNTHFTFPFFIFVVAVLATIQLVHDLPRGADVRVLFAAVLSWAATAIAAGSAYRYWGDLLIDVKGVAVSGRAQIPFDSLHIQSIQKKGEVLPHLELTGGRNGKLLLFPTKFYGLEANSLYSVLRHLAEVGAETRASYNPELIREMLLIKPDREVAVGDSIEVRVVAQPRATTP